MLYEYIAACCVLIPYHVLNTLCLFAFVSHAPLILPVDCLTMVLQTLIKKLILFRKLQTSLCLPSNYIFPLDVDAEVLYSVNCHYTNDVVKGFSL